MLFNTNTFAIFFAIVYAVYLLLSFRAQTWFLLLASWYFYACWNWKFLFLLLLSTTIDYWVGCKMEAAKDGARKRLITISVVVNLTILGIFKYFNFMVDSAAYLLQSIGLQPHLPTLNVLLPVGISFYTFQAMAYTIDVYRRDAAPCRDFATFALYVAYFPHLVAGPIQRTDDLLPQLLKPRQVTWAKISSGLMLILIGLLRKVALADVAASYVETAFSHPATHSGPELLQGLLLFALQIYGDFAGYTDIARGVSRMMGIELIENFRQPYFSQNVTELWHRWHISLSRWLRDYLYIPLGGNRGPRWFVYRNLMLTMLLGGLWHGASWNFVIWGGVHGLALAIHRWWSREYLGRTEAAVPQTTSERLRRGLARLASWALTMVVILVSWVFFRAHTWGGAMEYLHGLLTWAPGRGVAWLNLNLVPPILMVGLVDILQYRTRDQTPWVSWSWLLRGLFFGAVLVTILIWGNHDANIQFIYFQF